MKCPRCSTLVCYICRQDITIVKYDHFQQGGDSVTSTDRCLLYDEDGDVNVRHQEEVS
ncbi:hypothetical protein BJ165DRAFT_858679 [Panaeolus papilionaceus]|nr:hypothetical protein BJ165DRAFT_858679 [Panaeolus papilionaceus]